jgi:hypothetical protein
LVRLAFNKLLHIIGIPMWGVGFIPHNTFSRIEKDNDLVKIIWESRVGYSKLLNLAHDTCNWNFESIKFNLKKKCKPCSSTMNWKWFMAGKFANTFVLNIIFPLCIWIMILIFFLSLNFNIPQRRPLVQMQDSNLHFNINNFSPITM